MKRALAWFGLGFALAEVFAAHLPPLVLLPAAALLVVLLFWVRRKDARVPLSGAACGLLVFTVFFCVEVYPVEQRAGQTVRCTVTVETDAETSYQEGRQRGTLRVTQCDGGAADFLVHCMAYPATEPGERFTADFALQKIEDSPYLMSYKSRGVYLEAEYLGNYAAAEESRAPRFALYRLRRELARVLQAWMPAQEGELEAAMLLGHKDALREPVQDAFRAAGVSHLLAVSGLHVALLCGIFSFGRRRRFVRPLILLRAALVLFYMFLTGLPVSVLRAGLVFLLALAGDFFLQPVDLLTSTGAAAVLIGLQNAYAPCDVGFQLSFCAVVGVQLAGMLCRWQRGRVPIPQHKMLALARRGLLHAAEAVQVAVFASLATLPVLVAHGLTASGVSVLTNLLVVWMLQPALQLGVAVLLLSVLPPLQPLVHMVSLLLSVWLHWMTAIIVWCASLPAARVDLPARYTLLVLAVLGALAVVFWRARKMLWYLPAACACTAAAVALGIWAQRDIVRIALVGAANNPCVVCTQNGQAAVLFRGGQSNLRAVDTYLAEHALPEVTMVVDLRQDPSELDFGLEPITAAEQTNFYETYAILDGVTLDLYHKSSGNLAVLGVGTRHIAAMAGNIRLDEPLAVDVFCAAGALSESVQADAIVYCTASPAWAEDAGDERLYYSSREPVITIRPGRSMILEEVEPGALQ